MENKENKATKDPISEESQKLQLENIKSQNTAWKVVKGIGVGYLVIILLALLFLCFVISMCFIFNTALISSMAGSINQ